MHVSAIKIASVLSVLSWVSGHASLNPPVASSRYYMTDVRITHGLNKTASDMVLVRIPESIVSVRVSQFFLGSSIVNESLYSHNRQPKPVAGWTISMTKVNLTQPSAPDSHGAVKTDRVSEVIWSGSSLPDEYYDEFGLSLRLPVMKEGEKLYLTVCQRSPTLGWMNWSYVPGVADSGPEGYPAPFVTFFSNGTLTKLNATELQAMIGSEKPASSSGISMNMGLGLLMAVAALIL